MKKINSMIALVWLSVALFSSALLAQQSSAAVNHLGTNNSFKIGTSDNPVSATEFTNYLQHCARFDGEYCDSFMLTWWSPYTSGYSFLSYIEKAAIYRNSEQFPSLMYPRYSYSVRPGHENDIIDGVKSQRIQQEFENWRNNPSFQECFHLGRKDGFKIGTSDNPVLAQEYAVFLKYVMSSPLFLSSDTTDSHSPYYDFSFMDDSIKGSCYSYDPAIFQVTYQVPPDQGAKDHPYSYYYELIEGHEKDIIDTVQTQAIQQEFENWRVQGSR